MEEVILRLARECAELMITTQYAPNVMDDIGDTYHVTIKGIKYLHGMGCSTDESKIDKIVEDCRSELTKQIAHTIKTFLTIPPWASPISEERLREIWQEASVITNPEANHRYEDLYEHLTHLTHLIQVMSNENEGQIYAAGYDTGLKAGRAEK